MRPVNAIKHAVSSLSDDVKAKQAFIQQIEQIFDQYPEHADELLMIALDEVSKTSLQKPIRTEIITFLEQTKSQRIKKAYKGNSSSHSNGQNGTWNAFLNSTDDEVIQLSPGTIIRNTYQLEALLGVGGMGEVWKATHLIQDVAETADEDRFVAIKFLNTDFKNHPDALKTLAREFSYSRKLIHPNIVQVYELNYSGNQVYIAMEYLSGQPLDQWIKEHPKGISLDDAGLIIRGICDALKFAHSHKFIHLDIKPGNVIYDPATGMVKVIDFGIARHAKAIDRDITGFDLGDLNAVTGAYATLEMLRCTDPDPSDDIYGLACITYELLTGRHPYGKLPIDTALSKNLKPTPVSGLRPSQNNTLLKGLDLLRKRRIVDAEQFRNGLLPKDKDKTSIWFSDVPAKIVISVLLVAGSIWLVPKIVTTFYEAQLDPIRQGILAGKPAAAMQVLQSSKDDQYKILAKKEVINALLNVYTKTANDDPAHEFTALARPLRKRIYEDADFKNRLIIHYLQSIDMQMNQDAYPKADVLLRSIRSIYPDSNQLAEKKTTLQMAKNQKLTLLVQQLESCFLDDQASSTQLTACFDSNQPQLLKIALDMQLPLKQVDNWFTETIHDLLNQKKLKVSAHLLKNWPIAEKNELPSRSILRDALTIGRAEISSLSEPWAKFVNDDADRRLKLLTIKPAQDKLLDFVIEKASLSAKQNNYPGAFKILNDAIDIVKNHSDSMTRLNTALSALKQEHNEVIERLNSDYQTTIKNCDLVQLKIREAIQKIAGKPLTEQHIDQHCIASIRNAIINNDPEKVTNLLDNWKNLNPKSPPEFNALKIAMQVRFDDVGLQSHLLSLVNLPTEQRQLALDIAPVRGRLVNFYQQTVEQKVAESGYPSALQFLDEMTEKISSHPETLTALRQLHSTIKKRQKRKIVSLLFEYQRELVKCSEQIGVVQTQLQEVGLEQPPFNGIDESCFQELQELLAKEDIALAESMLETWRQLRPDDNTTYLQERKLIAEKLTNMKSQLDKIQTLIGRLRQSLSHNDEIQLTDIMTTQVSLLTSAYAKRFWKTVEKELVSYFIAKAKDHLNREEFNDAQIYCDRGLAKYPKSTVLQANCKELVQKQRNQRISELRKMLLYYLENGWLVTGVRYPGGLLGIFDAISTIDNNHAVLKSNDVHLSFKKALLDAVRKMQLDEARSINDKWAIFFDRNYTSDDAISIRESAKNQSATYALSIARDMIHEDIKDRAKELLRFGLELKPVPLVAKQIKDELTHLNREQQ